MAKLAVTVVSAVVSCGVGRQTPSLQSDEVVAGIDRTAVTAVPRRRG